MDKCPHTSLEVKVASGGGSPFQQEDKEMVPLQATPPGFTTSVGLVELLEGPVACSQSLLELGVLFHQLVKLLPERTS